MLGKASGVGLLVGVSVLNLWTVPSGQAAGPQVDVEQLRPGLVATFRDRARPVHEVCQLDPTIALALLAGEAAHPRLASDGCKARWEGYLRILRPGPYRFTALLRGRFRLTVGEREVLSGDVKDDVPALLKGPETPLAAGVYPIVGEFTQLPGKARLEVFWESPHFHAEPLHHDALGHLPDRLPAGLAASRSADLGRFLVEEHSCVRCHRPADTDRLAPGLVVRQGPDLSDVGRRIYAGWIYRWLEDPQKIRAAAVMPRLFDDGEAGRVERYAVARYLSSLGGPARDTAQKREAAEVRSFVERGRRLFTSVGCIACHGPQAKESAEPKDSKEAAPGLPFALIPPRQFPLGAVGSKQPLDRLLDYLSNPLAVDPSGRMPHVPLQQQEALTLAYFLNQTRDPSIAAAPPEAPSPAARRAAFERVSRREDRAAFERLPADAQWLDLGRRLVIDKGCNNCHTIAPGGKAFASVLASASFADLTKPGRQAGGCLADSPPRADKAPRFALKETERRAIRAFLREEAGGAGSPAPAFAARRALERFNCLACHVRDGEGGLTPGLTDELRRHQQADNAEAITPPPLTGIGHKLRTPWVRHVLTEEGRARPWMALRMPQFGIANVGRLPEALAALEGTVPDETLHPVALSTAKIAAGRKLVGKTAFGCISCHDLAGIPNSGTRGPDLAGMNQRVRYEWYRRWLEQPQRYQPGTRMPTIFPDGKSLVPGVLEGSADAQADAIWTYLSLGSNLPLPEGMEPPRGLVLTVKDRPILLRTFMPDVGSRAVAVGYPGSVAAVFDADNCRLAYAWSGNFLDASPVWDGRGGNPARPLGPRFWTAPAGCPWGLNASNEPPDFAAQARDPSYGAALPEGHYYAGPRRLRFEGYHTDRAGLPTFEYQLQADDTQGLQVRERPEPLRSPAGFGLARHFDLQVPAGRTAWLLAGEGEEPRVLDAQGTRVAMDLRSGAAQVPADGRAIALPQGGGRAIVLLLKAGPRGAEWYLRHPGPSWQVILRLPAAEKSREVPVQLAVWAPYRDEPGLLKDLLTTR